jgi:hypothetical protein
MYVSTLPQRTIAKSTPAENLKASWRFVLRTKSVVKAARIINGTPDNLAPAAKTKEKAIPHGSHLFGDL